MPIPELHHQGKIRSVDKALQAPGAGVDRQKLGCIHDTAGKALAVSAIQHGVSCNSYWHMARPPALQQALSNDWLLAQGLLSIKTLWCRAQG